MMLSRNFNSPRSFPIDIDPVTLGFEFRISVFSRAAAVLGAMLDAVCRYLFVTAEGRRGMLYLRAR